MPQFPPEIIDMVIDHLFDNTKALLACSLVCKGWLSSSRFHLLSDVSIEFDVQKLNSTTAEEPLFDLLSAPTSTLASYLKRLRLAGTCGQLIHQRSPVFERAVNSIWNLTGLHTLALEDISWQFATKGCQNIIRTSFPHLKSLSLSNVIFQTYTELADVINAFPKLQSLSIGKGVRISKRSSANLASLNSSICRLRSLSIDERSKGPLLALMLSQPMSNKITQLQLRSITASERPIVDEFIHRHAHSITNLTLDFERPGKADALSGMNLRDLTSLRSLTFENLLMYQEFSSDDATDFTKKALELLSTVNSGLMERVEFHLWMLNSVTELDTINWAHLESVFSQSQFTSIKRIQFRLFGVTNSFSPKPDVWIKDKLPTFTARELLGFDGLTPSRRR